MCNGRFAHTTCVKSSKFLNLFPSALKQRLTCPSARYCYFLSSLADIELSCGEPRIANADADSMGYAAAVGFVGKTVRMACRFGYAPEGTTSRYFHATCLPSGKWQGLKDCPGEQECCENTLTLNKTCRNSRFFFCQKSDTWQLFKCIKFRMCQTLPTFWNLQ